MNNDYKIMQQKITHNSDPDVIKNFNTVRDSVEFNQHSTKHANNNMRRNKIDKSNVKSKYKNKSFKLPDISSPVTKLSLSEADEWSLNLPFKSFRQQSKEILTELDHLTSVDEESRKRKVVTNGVKNNIYEKDINTNKNKSDKTQRLASVDQRQIIEDIYMEDVYKFRKLNDN